MVALAAAVVMKATDVTKTEKAITAAEVLHVLRRSDELCGFRFEPLASRLLAGILVSASFFMVITESLCE